MKVGGFALKTNWICFICSHFLQTSLLKGGLVTLQDGMSSTVLTLKTRFMFISGELKKARRVVNGMNCPLCISWAAQRRVQKLGKWLSYDTPGVLRTCQIHFTCYFILKWEFRLGIHMRDNPFKMFKHPLKSKCIFLFCWWCSLRNCKWCRMSEWLFCQSLYGNVGSQVLNRCKLS